MWSNHLENNCERINQSSAVPSAEILEVFLTNSLDPHQTVLDQFSLPLYLHKNIRSRPIKQAPSQMHFCWHFKVNKSSDDVTGICLQDLTSLHLFIFMKKEFELFQFP